MINCLRLLLGLGVLIFGIPVESKAPQPSTDQSIEIAVWRLKPLGLDSATAEKLELLLRAEIARLPGFELQSQEIAKSMLSNPKHGHLRECVGGTCLCAVGKALQVDKLVTGVIGALGEQFTFDLKLLNVGTCGEERRINEAFSGQEDLLIGAIRQALFKLVVPEHFLGSMAVEIAVDGAEILVDGKSVGRSPLQQPITDLQPGRHTLEIRKTGFSTFQESIWVRFEQTTRVKVDLVSSSLVGVTYEKESERVLAAVSKESVVRERGSLIKILAWSSLGVTVGAALAASLLGWRSQVQESNFEDAVSELNLNAGDRAVLDRGQTLALWSNVGWGVATGTAILTVVLFVLDATQDESIVGTPRISTQVGNQQWGVVLECSF